MKTDLDARTPAMNKSIQFKTNQCSKRVLCDIYLSIFHYRITLRSNIPIRDDGGGGGSSNSKGKKDSKKTTERTR